jgi:hypothetical protein
MIHIARASLKLAMESIRAARIVRAYEDTSDKTRSKLIGKPTP